MFGILPKGLGLKTKNKKSGFFRKVCWRGLPTDFFQLMADRVLFSSWNPFYHRYTLEAIVPIAKGKKHREDYTRK